MAKGPEVMPRCVLAILQHADKKGCPVGDFLGKINRGRERPPHEQMQHTVRITWQREGAQPRCVWLNAALTSSVHRGKSLQKNTTAFEQKT